MSESKSNVVIRVLLVITFVVLTLPLFPMVGFKIRALSWLVYTDLFLRAVPLYLAWRVDSAFYDAGELSPQLLPLWVVLTGIMLWPLATVGLNPRVWKSRIFRRIVYGYSCVAIVGTFAAASWVFTHTGVFF